MEVEDILEHHGVKGQKWGVRRESGGASNHSVFVATGSKPKIGQEFNHDGQTHVVARAVTRADGKHVITTQQQQKADLGAKLARIVKKDKEYWQKAAAVAGVGVVGLAAAAVAPAVVPASVILAAGGPAILSTKIALGTGIATRLGYSHNYLQYIRRTRAAKALAHAVSDDPRTVGEVYDMLTPEKKFAANLLIASYSQGEEFGDDPDVQNGWASMTPTERSVVLFLASGTDSQPSVEHTDEKVDEVLSHFMAREFNESMVKRGKGGKFAKVAVKSNKLSEEEINKKLDKMWESSMIENMRGLWENNSSQIENAVKQMALAKGITNPEDVWKDPKLTSDAMAVALDYMNNTAIPQSIEGVSPSGTQKIEVGLKPGAAARQGPDAISYKAVPYNGVNPHPATTEELRKELLNVQRLDTQDSSKSGFHFNPNAVLDPSRVHGVSHSDDRIDEILEHHGVKGQKWGVRKDLVGLSDLSPGGGMAIGKTRGSAELTKKEIKTVSSATEAVRKTLMDKTGMMSPNGPIAALNKAHRAQYKDTQPTPAQIKDYDKKFTAIAESHANAVAPRGTVARVHLDGPDMFLFVGEKSAVERAMSEFRHDDLTTKLVVIRDETGAIVEIRPSSLEHSDDPVDDILAHHGIKGQKWGVRRQTGASGLVSRIVGKKATDTANPGNKPDGLIPRTGSADQIHQDRIQKKIDTNGINSLSNAEIQSYTRRLQMEKDIKTALAAQSAATQAKADGFIKSFIKKQGGRQADRFVNKALDVAFEAAVKQAGVKLEPNNPALGKGLQEVGKRLAPKKK